MRKRLTVDYERDQASGWWTAQVKEEPGAITQGRTVAEARRRIRKALWALWDDKVAAEAVEIRDNVKLPAKVRRAVASSLQAFSERDAAQRTAKVRVRAAVRVLQQERLSLRDTADLLGVRRQYVHQVRRQSLTSPRRAAKRA